MRDPDGYELLGEALDVLSYLEPDALEDAGVAEEDLFPIGWSPVAIDVFTTVGSAPEPRPVIWFAGLEVERFESFEVFFQYLTDSSTRLAEGLRDQASNR